MTIPTKKLQARLCLLEGRNATLQDNIRVINIARMDLERKKIETEEVLLEQRSLLQQERAKNTLLNVENARLKQHNKDLEEEVRKEHGRVSQVLSIAESASAAAGSVGYLCNAYAETVVMLNTTIATVTKEIRR